MEEWTGPKWWLLFSSLTVFGYGCACLVLSLATLFRAYPSAEIPATLDPALLVLSTLLSSLLLLSSICGLTGTLLSSRFTLSIYTILLFPSFFSLLAVGYTAYKRHTFALPSKLDHAWSAYLTPYGRLLIQSSLKCCGWFSPSHEATLSSRCYPRIALPGCKARLIRYERATLKWVYTTAFSLAPLHMVNMVIALLCSNHVNRVWGMRVPPRKYWLSGEDVREAASRGELVGGGV
ncbi:Tetraspanin/Peripherin [Pterulicium gracile]|uniref:Tetraspanin/Peripherin n=1 Tax=Pterulicium gracile TaxID=1884261 RepID=A0A5C3QW88_9AGAR|nr:Tetraspanin/Peripherin [Pterula gracilis]